MILIFVFLSGMLAAWIFNELELMAWRRSSAAHWTERARKLFPARVSRQINLWAIPAGLTMAGRFLDPGTPWMAAALCSILGTLLGNFPMDRATHPGLPFGEWAHEVFSTLCLQLSGWATFALAAFLMPDHPDWRIGVVTAGFFLLHFSLQFGLGLRLMRGLRLLQPAPARLQSLVEETSASMGVKVRATWELISVNANAIAFVTTRELAFTRKLLAICSDEEIKAVCAHELGHLSESRWTLAGRLVGSLILFPLIFVRPIYGQWQWAGLPMLGFAVVLIWLGKLRLSQTMEKRADQIARESVAEQTIYARALERLYRANQIPAVLRKSSAHAHPDLYDRMVAAGLTPDYPRPAAPSGQGWTSIVTTVICAVLAMSLNAS